MMDDSDFEFLDLGPRSWADAFPWIPAKAANQGWKEGKWWEWSIDDADTAARNSIVHNSSRVSPPGVDDQPRQA